MQTSDLRPPLPEYRSLSGKGENVKVATEERHVDCPAVFASAIHQPDGVGAAMPAVVADAPDLAALVASPRMGPQPGEPNDRPRRDRCTRAPTLLQRTFGRTPHVEGLTRCRPNHSAPIRRVLQAGASKAAWRQHECCVRRWRGHSAESRVLRIEGVPCAPEAIFNAPRASAMATSRNEVYSKRSAFTGSSRAAK